jgi:hypothetical protein
MKMPKRKREDELTVSRPISVTLPDGRMINGTIWMHVSRRGRFEVEYGGRRKSDGRSDYTSEGHMSAIAKFLLTEMAQEC